MRYAETDQMGVVYYANYLVGWRWAAWTCAKPAASTTATWNAKTAFSWRWRSRNCRYRSPARFDDEVIVKTWIEEANTRIVDLAYEMRLADSDRVLATG